MILYEGLRWAFWIAVEFLSGSVMYSRILPLVLLKKDICKDGKEQNPGASNVFMTCGVPMGLACLSLDVLKGLLPVVFAKQVLDTGNILFALVMLAPVLGHAIAPFHHFQGGKCIAVSFGVTFALLPEQFAGPILAVLYIALSALRIRPHRKRSLLAFLLFGLSAGAIAVWQGAFSFLFGYLGIAAVVMLRHTRRFCDVQAEEPVAEQG